RRDLVLADLDVVQLVGDNLPDRLLGVDAGPRLIDIAELDRVADPDRAAVRLLETHDGLEQRGLPDTVGTDDADDAVSGQRERQILNERASLESLVEMVDLDDDAAEPRPGRDLDLLEVELAGLLGFGRLFLVTAQSGLALGLPRLHAGADPCQLIPEPLLQLCVL